MQPVPVGVTGELYIGGAGVARGYMGDPALTGARFVPDPWSGETGARLYRTGDLVRWCADGRLEYQGRADQQVKIRGHRIEPGEIEAALNEHEWVRASVVVARDGGPGLDQLLVAYIVPAFASEEKRELSRLLRQYLQARVPDYMVPNLFVELAQLPLTSSGKVDRKALPEPPSYSAEMGENYEAPRTHVEEVLCGIWAEVLRLDQVGINDNFFELGGHSLLATRLLARVQNAFEVRLPLRSVFEAPTVRGMAESLFDLTGERLRIEETAEVLVQLSQISEEEAAAMLDMQLAG
jgi:acyl carrier protein